MVNMKRLSIVWGITMLIIFGSLTAFGFFYKSKTSKYKELEEYLVKSESKYVNDFFLFPKGKDILKTSKAELIEKGYLESLEVDGETCDGYVMVQDTGTTFKYKAYIKCDNYVTKDYEE